MKQRIAVIGLLLMMTGCIPAHPDPSAPDPTSDEVKNTTKASAKSNFYEASAHLSNLGDASKQQFYHVMDHVADWMRPDQPKPPKAIPATYCYHTLQDILCYHQPMPGWEHRLVSYQPLDAPPPPPATMQPMAQAEPDTRNLPANRVAAAQPVFVSAPPPVAPSEKAVTPEAHESLPDPTLAPQL